jgi:hypothetical protein
MIEVRLVSKYKYGTSPAHNKILDFTKQLPQPRVLERARLARDFWRTVTPVSMQVRIWIQDHWYTILGLARVLKLTLRNFHGHIGILLSKNPSVLGCGPMLEVDHEGHLFLNRRTYARVVGIQELNTLYPWASSIEERIFLAGFHMGEEFALHQPDTSLEEVAYLTPPVRIESH